MADPNALYSVKPDVNKHCLLDKQHVATIGISPPQNVDSKTLSQESILLTWEEPAETGGYPISHYKIFVNEKDSISSTLKIETTDGKTQYRLKTPKSMWGKDYVFYI